VLVCNTDLLFILMFYYQQDYDDFNDFDSVIFILGVQKLSGFISGCVD